MEKEVKEQNSNNRASPPKHANPTKPERSMRLVSDLKHLSLAANLLALSHQSAEEDVSLPTGIEENQYEQATKVVKEAGGLELHKSSKKSVDGESGFEVCRRFVGNDLLVLANAASLAVSRQVSNEVVAEEKELVTVLKDVKPNRDPSDGCREDKLFTKKYFRKKRVNDKETSVGAVSGTSNLVKKLSKQKPSFLITVDDAEREEGLYNNCETHSKPEQVEAVDGQCRCSGIQNKTKSKTQSRYENQEIPQNISLIPHILGIKKQEIPKRKRSQRKRKPKEPKKNSVSSLGKRREEKERACDKIDSEAGDSETEPEEDNDADKLEKKEEEEEEMIVSESEGFLPLLEEAETEEEEEEDVSDATSCNCWSFTNQPRTCKGIRHVQWSNKKKRNCMKLEETQSNRKILLLAVEAISHQLGLLDVSMEEKSS